MIRSFSLLLLLLSSSVWARPAGTCTDPIWVQALGGMYTGTTKGAPTGLAGSCGMSEQAPSVVYAFQAVEDGMLAVSTSWLERDYYSTLWVRGGSCESGRE